MRQTIADDNSNEDEWKIYDYFDVTLKYECDDDALTKGTDIGAWVYVLGGAESTKKHIPTQSVSSCALTMACEIWDEDA